MEATLTVLIEIDRENKSLKVSRVHGSFFIYLITMFSTSYLDLDEIALSHSDILGDDREQLIQACNVIITDLE